MKPHLPWIIAGLILILGLSGIQTALEQANKQDAVHDLAQCQAQKSTVEKRLHESIASDALVCQGKLDAAASDAASCLEELNKRNAK